MSDPKSRGLGLLLAAGLAVVGTAQATTLTKMHVDDMAVTADTVIVGQLAGQETIHDGGAISRLLTFTVEEAVTGKPGERVMVTLPGGSIETAGIRVGEVNAGVPVFTLDSSSVLFLTETDADGHRQILGFSQGSFAISNGEVQVSDLGATLSLADFKARIKAHAQ